MTGSDYKKYFVNKPKKNKKSAEDEVLESAPKRSRSIPASGSGETSHAAIIQLPSDPDSPIRTIATAPASIVPPPPSSVAELISLRPGELWQSGVSDRLRAVIRPPSAYLGESSLNAEMRKVLNLIEENSLKSASLIQTYQGLQQRLDSSKASNSSLAEAKNLADKSKADLEARLEEARRAQKKAEDDLAAANQSAITQKQNYDTLLAQKDEVSKSLQERESKLTKVEADLKRARDDYAQACLDVVHGVTQAWDNAIAQAQVLNPGMTIDGMDLSYSVRDGHIVPGTPGRDASEDDTPA